MEYFSNSKITELPYLLSTQYTKSISDGQVKEQYQLRYIVLNSEANSFIESLPISYEEHALASTSRDERGGFSIITAQYGEAGLTEEALQTEDGELQWWTLSNGKYTYHVKKLVQNNPDSIKAFCEYCKSSYGYSADETSVTMSPSYGEKYVYAEATFTENESQGGSAGGSGGDFDDDEADENGNIETVESVTMSSAQEILPVPVSNYLNTKFAGWWESLQDLVNAEDAGTKIYRKAGSMNGIVKTSGWYDATDDNLKSIEEPPADSFIPEDDTHSPENVHLARIMINNPPSILSPAITVTLSVQIKSRNPLSLASLTNKIQNTGQLSESISLGSFNMDIPEYLKKQTDSEGNEYPLVAKWQNLGTSFDIQSVKKKYGKNQMPYFTGSYTTQFKTVVTFHGQTYENGDS